MDARTNDIVLALRDGTSSHFRLKEFQNADGLVMVHPRLLECLEALRERLCLIFAEEIWIIVTGGIRTEADNARLAATLGWADQGGLVGRDSKHLVKYGGIAADIKAFKAVKDRDGIRERISQRIVGYEARRIFPYVKDDYRDGHVHVDVWDRAKGRVA